MQIYRFKIMVFLLGSLFLTNDASGFDGRREGFSLGIGLGAGASFMNQELGTLRQDTAIGSGQFRIQVAKGLNERLMLTFSSRLSMYPFDDIDTIPEETDMFDSFDAFLEELFIELPAKALTNHHTFTVGVIYFLKPETPSIFFQGGIGVSTFPTFIDNDIHPGFAIVAGAGYEFRRHFTCEVEFLASFANETSGPNTIHREFGGLTFSLQWLMY